MTILQRLRNIWKLGEIDSREKVLTMYDPIWKAEEKPRMAQVIHRTTPAEDFINNAKE